MILTPNYVDMLKNEIRSQHWKDRDQTIMDLIETYEFIRDELQRVSPRFLSDRNI